MPFTPTHVLAILPIAALKRPALPFSALVIGSMIPDLPLFVPLSPDYGTTHFQCTYPDGRGACHPRIQALAVRQHAVRPALHRAAAGGLAFPADAGIARRTPRPLGTDEGRGVSHHGRRACGGSIFRLASGGVAALRATRSIHHDLGVGLDGHDPGVLRRVPGGGKTATSGEVRAQTWNRWQVAPRRTWRLRTSRDSLTTVPTPSVGTRKADDAERRGRHSHGGPWERGKSTTATRNCQADAGPTAASPVGLSCG